MLHCGIARNCDYRATFRPLTTRKGRQARCEVYANYMKEI